MRVTIAGCVALSAAMAFGVIEGRAQQQPPPPPPQQQQPEPRPPDPVPPANLARPNVSSGDPRIGRRAADRRA